MAEKIPVSVVVLTKNEEARIATCLSSVTWADEIIVVDDESSDATREIAKRFTDRILVRAMEVEGTHRNWAYAQARNEWVLSLDADEVVTPELARAIAALMRTVPKEHGFIIPIRNHIGSTWVRHSGWYPSYKLRFFRKEQFRYEDAAVHPRAFMEGPSGKLTGDILHYSYRDIEGFLAKMNRDTTREAQKWLKQGRPMRLGHFIWRTGDRFLRSYIAKKGYKDGLYGFVVAFIGGLYQFVSYLKYRELTLPKENKE